MVGFSIDREFDEECLINDSDLIREFGGMSAFDFVYYGMMHQEDACRTISYLGICNDAFREKVLMWCDMWHGYELN